MLNKGYTLYNNVSIPPLFNGLYLNHERTFGNYSNISWHFLEKVFISSFQNGIIGFDTAHDYARSEEFIGKIIKNLIRHNYFKREDIFITTKIGNGQQYEGNIDACVHNALKKLNTDYIDLMLFHWPLPDYYIDNWKKLENIYDSGKVKAIGIANCKIRHLTALFASGIKYKPHVVQFEYHPFRTVPDLVQMCKENNIIIQAYSPFCTMEPFVTRNKLLNDLAQKYNKSIAQIILRWDVQQDIIPVFRSYNENRIKENNNIFDFELEKTDMDKIFELNIDYKGIIESLFCPGY
jgi:diketogulonate reductase-like aldo/keto reductase